MTATDLQLQKFLMAIPGPERDDLFEFLGAAKKTSGEIERVVDSLNTSISLKHLGTARRFN
ncbi:MAG: hypothetical protein KUG69_10190 [Marinosulfonomonas sp.]|nr:hypothetical protein [Marinosulfonomonas sp.]